MDLKLKQFFNKIKSEVLVKQEKQKNDPKFIENQSHWVKCPSCESLMYLKRLKI